MAVVHQKVCSQGGRAEVIDAAGTIGDIAQDEDVLSAGKAAGRRGGALVALLQGQSWENRVGRRVTGSASGQATQGGGGA